MVSAAQLVGTTWFADVLLQFPSLLVFRSFAIRNATLSLGDFRAVGDLERILARIALRSARPRDLSTLRDGLGLLPRVRDCLGGIDGFMMALVSAYGRWLRVAMMLERADYPDDKR